MYEPISLSKCRDIRPISLPFLKIVLTIRGDYDIVLLADDSDEDDGGVGTLKTYEDTVIKIRR